jgi:hypothetical protein
LGNITGYGNEIKQLKDQFFQSAFDKVDLYSNAKGIEFFDEYQSKINKNPDRIVEYIYEFTGKSDPEMILQNPYWYEHKY